MKNFVLTCTFIYYFSAIFLIFLSQFGRFFYVCEKSTNLLLLFLFQESYLNVFCTQNDIFIPPQTKDVAFSDVTKV